MSGLAGASVPIGLVGGAFLAQAAAPNFVVMFLLPAVIGLVFVLAFALVLRDRRLAPGERPASWSIRDLAGTFWVDPRRHPDFAWAWISRFMLVLGYAFLTTYQAFYLIDKIGSAESDVPGQVFLATLALAVTTLLSSLVGGRLSDVTGRRKIFVVVAAVIYGIALFLAATATGLGGFLVAMAVAGVGFGTYAAVDLALVADVLPDPDDAAKDMGVFNIASTLPQSVAPAIAPLILALGGGSYGVLYAAAGVAALISAVSILPVRKVR